MKQSRKAVRFAEEVENDSAATSQRTPMCVPSQPSLSQKEDNVCDYDTSVTRLYQLIEASDWDGAAERCRTHPDEARTWVIRRQKDPKKIRWKLLPLLTAVIFQSPEYVVLALLQEYPQAIKATDDQGMTPLHLAFRHYQHDEALLKLLLKTHPHAIIAKDYRGRTPLDLAMKRNGKFSAKLMHLYATTCIEIALQAADESWREEVGNEEEIECPVDEEVDDKLAHEECQRDEIALLESMEECEHAVREQPELDQVSRETEVDEYGSDEMVQLEQAEQNVIESIAESKMEDQEREQQLVSEGISVEDDESSKDEPPNETEFAGETKTETNARRQENGLEEFWSAEDEDFETAREEEKSLNVSDAGVPNKEEMTTVTLREKHEKELATIRQHYEDRIQAMAYHTMATLHKLHQDTRAANRALKEQYYHDLQRIKNHFTAEEKKSSDTTVQLRNEIIRLQLRLGGAQQVQSNVDTRDLTRDLQALQRDQLLLQRLIRDQQKELDTAQAIRALMLKSLWQQDEEEGACRKIETEAITTLVDRIQSRFELLSPETPFDETRDAVETTESRSNQDDDDDDISTITDHSPL